MGSQLGTGHDRERAGEGLKNRRRWGVMAIAAAVLGALALAACGGSGGTTTSSSTASSSPPPATEPASETSGAVGPEALVEAASPSNAELEEGAGADWPVVGGDLGNTRYSSLEEIDAENVSKLHLVWQGSYSPKMDAIAEEEESNPLEADGVMYLITPEDNAVA